MVLIPIAVILVVFWFLVVLFGKKSEETGEKSSNLHLLGAAILLSVPLMWMIKSAMTVSEPGAYYEKSEYAGDFYVNLFTDRNGATNYRLPARIAAYLQDGSYGEEDSGPHRKYNLVYVTFPNGGKLMFDQADLKLGRKVHAIDKNGKSWYIELTSDPVN